MLLSGVTQSMDSFLQFITVLIIFIAVLFITFFTTKWMAGYQKNKMSNTNIQVIETSKLAGSKFIQIIRIGDKYVAAAVCKDSVTVLCEIPPDQIKSEEDDTSGHSFDRIFDVVKNHKHGIKDASVSQESEDDTSAGDGADEHKDTDN